MTNPLREALEEAIDGMDDGPTKTVAYSPKLGSLPVYWIRPEGFDNFKKPFATVFLMVSGAGDKDAYENVHSLALAVIEACEASPDALLISATPLHDHLPVPDSDRKLEGMQILYRQP